MLALKGNQGTLYEEVKEYFGDAEFLRKIREKANGQIETREYYQTEDIRWLEQKKNRKGLKSIIMEKKTLSCVCRVCADYPIDSSNGCPSNFQIISIRFPG